MIHSIAYDSAIAGIQRDDRLEQLSRFYPKEAGRYPEEALETIIRDLADELGKLPEVDKWLSKVHDYRDLEKLYKGLGGEIL